MCIRDSVTPFDEVYYALKTITDDITGVADKNKVVLGVSMSNIGWTVVDGQITNSRGNTYSYSEIADMIDDGAEVKYSDKYKNPYLIYDSDDGKEIVWYENSRSIADKVKLAEMLGVSGISDVYKRQAMTGSFYTVYASVGNLHKSFA